MSAAEIKEMRNETRRYLDHADERLLRIIHTILKADINSENLEREYAATTPEQDAILKERLEKYEKGLMQFSSWEEIESKTLPNKNDDVSAGGVAYDDATVDMLEARSNEIANGSVKTYNLEQTIENLKKSRNA